MTESVRRGGGEEVMAHCLPERGRGFSCLSLSMFLSPSSQPVPVVTVPDIHPADDRYTAVPMAHNQEKRLVSNS